ncbi:hypothetical protein SAMN05421863_104927 [Nitrosomonas communis]|uniref:Uncharacterized protein n=1 Tax=Nitrosomonas communis TaxID=44574 RepID=A0A1I4TDR8_9PROT|nr:hypothetical protein SAMN05421863_104927 [Nitrosomonas communis]
MGRGQSYLRRLEQYQKTVVVLNVLGNYPVSTKSNFLRLKYDINASEEIRK